MRSLFLAATLLAISLPAAALSTEKKTIVAQAADESGSNVDLRANEKTGLKNAGVNVPKDFRVVYDRLDPTKNPDRFDASVFNGIGATRSKVERGTGFLIDRCHVMTARHVVYGDEAKDSQTGMVVDFYFGEPEDGGPGVAQGLSTRMRGTVVADGSTNRHESDWALIHLDKSVQTGIAFLPIRATLTDSVPSKITTAGFPGNHEQDFPGRAFKNLWVSRNGQVLGVFSNDSKGPGYITSLSQITLGDSGGPIIVKKDGKFYSIGMAQSGIGTASSKRDEIDMGLAVDEAHPAVFVLFTPYTAERIQKAVEESLCSR